MQFFTCKDKNEIHELTIIHPYLLVVLADLVRFCHDSKYPAPIITSLCRTTEENELVGGESDTHVTRRAFDISSRNYSSDQIKNIVTYLNTSWVKYAAMNTQGQIRLAVHHKVPGGAPHTHIQIAKRYSLPEFTGEIK
jgi:hypothetical protein